MLLKITWQLWSPCGRCAICRPLGQRSWSHMTCVLAFYCWSNLFAVCIYFVFWWATHAHSCLLYFRGRRTMLEGILLGILGVASLTIIVLAALLASRDNQIGQLRQVKTSSKTDQTPVTQQTARPPEKPQGLKHYSSCLSVWLSVYQSPKVMLSKVGCIITTTSVNLVQPWVTVVIN